MARPFCAYGNSLLRDSVSQIDAADNLLASAKSWLRGQVDTARDRIAECIQPPTKRQRCASGRGKSVFSEADKESCEAEQGSVKLENGPARALRRSTRSKRSRQVPYALRTVPEEDEVVEEPIPTPEQKMESIAEEESPGHGGPGEASQEPETLSDLEAVQQAAEEAALPPTKTQKRPRKGDKQGKALTAAAKRKAAAAAAEAAQAAAAALAADMRPEEDQESATIVEQPLPENQQEEAIGPANINSAATPADQHVLGDDELRRSARRTKHSHMSAQPDPADASPAVLASETPLGTRISRRLLRSATSAPTTSRRVLRSRTVAAETPRETATSRERSAPGPTPATTRSSCSRTIAAQTAAASPAGQADEGKAAQPSPQIQIPDLQLNFATPARPSSRITRQSVRLSSCRDADRSSRDPAAPSVADSAEAHQSTQIMHQVASAGKGDAAPSPPQAADSALSSPQQSPTNSVQPDSASRRPSLLPPTVVAEMEQHAVLEDVAASPPAACTTAQIADAASPADTARTRDLSPAPVVSSPKPVDTASQAAASVSSGTPAAEQLLTPQTQGTGQSADEPNPRFDTASAERLMAERAVIDEAAAEGDAAVMALMATLHHTGTPPEAAMTAAAQLKAAARMALPASVKRGRRSLQKASSPPLESSPSLAFPSDTDVALPSDTDAAAAPAVRQEDGSGSIKSTAAGSASCSTGATGSGRYSISAPSGSTVRTTASSRALRAADDGNAKDGGKADGSVMANLKSNVVSGFRSFLAPRLPPSDKDFGAAPRKEPVKVAALEAARAAKAREEDHHAARQAKQHELARRREQARARNTAETLAKQQQQQREGEERRRKAELRARARQDDENRRKNLQNVQPNAKRVKPAQHSQQQQPRQPLALRPQQQQPSNTVKPPSKQLVIGQLPPSLPVKEFVAPAAVRPTPPFPANGSILRPLASSTLAAPVPKSQQQEAQVSAAGDAGQAGTLQGGAAPGKKGMLATATEFVMGAVRSTPVAAPVAAGGTTAAPQSYEISPYRSDNDDSEDDIEEAASGIRKVYPAWAHRTALAAQLTTQLHIDPDEIFLHNKKTCALNEVFGHADPVKIKAAKDYSRRTSSGNWIEDRVTAKEQITYKKAMGYL